MASYRFFLLNSQGRTLDGLVEDCADDRDALENARAMSVNRIVEIWQSGRHVAMVGGAALNERERAAS